MKVFAYLIQLGVVTVALTSCSPDASLAFPFRSYERQGTDGLKKAQDNLHQRFPVGSDMKTAIKYVENGGAKCSSFVERGEGISLCTKYVPWYGTRLFIIDVEWTVVITSDPQFSSVSHIGAGRQLSVP